MKDATAAVAVLHTKVVEGGRLWARQVSGEGQYHKKWRLIVRNLSFKVQELHPLPHSCVPAHLCRQLRSTPIGFGKSWCTACVCCMHAIVWRLSIRNIYNYSSSFFLTFSCRLHSIMELRSWYPLLRDPLHQGSTTSGYSFSLTR